MPALSEMVDFCDARTRRVAIADFPGSHNGLQFENNGTVTRVGAAVDAGIEPFRAAIARGVDFLIVHHGMFWRPPVPITGPLREKLRVLYEGNLAVYGAHLPLDCHPEIGNNALLAKRIGLEVSGWFLNYEGNDIAARVDSPGLSRAELAARLREQFAKTFLAIEAGPETPQAIGILTGSGSSAVDKLAANGIDTFITGELKQEHFNYAQEWGLNLYLCGHYATEVFGVRALAEEAARHFGLESEFIWTDCPL